MSNDIERLLASIAEIDIEALMKSVNEVKIEELLKECGEASTEELSKFYSLKGKVLKWFIIGITLSVLRYIC
jgi:hypothetical protein